MILAETSFAEEQKTLPALETIHVTASKDEISEKTGAYHQNNTGASKLAIEAKQTPQTINTLTHQQMQDFAINNVRDVLSHTTGVTTSNLETDRTSFMARGFEISNINKDGIGFPEGNYNYHEDNTDTWFYDRVEVVKGADALNNAFGDPSATVNLIRKRPTTQLQAQANISYGSWDNQRYELDVSGKLLHSGAVRGRIMAYQSQGNSYLDRYFAEKNGVSAVVEADLTDKTLLSVGVTQTQNKPNANNWGSNPLINSAGQQINHARGYNYAPDWAYWDSDRQNYFVRLEQKLGQHWQAQAHYEHSEIDNTSKLLYLSGTVAADNTSGLYLYPSRFIDQQKNKQFSLTVNGKVPLFNRLHELSFGYRYGQKSTEQQSFAGALANHITSDLASWTPTEPQWASTSGSGASYQQRFNSLFVASRWHLNDALKLLAGANYVQAKSSGLSYGADQSYNEKKVSPYAGLTYDFNPNYTGYISYTSIFRPQTGTDTTTGKAIDPIKGKSYELGLKTSWLDDRLTGTIAIFRTEEQNYPLRASDNSNPLNQLVQATDLRSQGVELGLNGQITDNLMASVGYSKFSLRDLKNGGEARTYTPHQSFNLMTSYKIPALPKLKVGAGVRWYDKTYLNVAADTTQSAGTIRQKAYALVDLMANYEFNRHVSLQLNANNVTNTEYLHEFPFKHGMKGAPANYMATISFRY
ncbi:MAG: TonB-dependent siderophore receptor [Acinetobacter sp.]|nr:TonB-dependent siderophore receptor [Acinetobacter sp.]